MTRDTQESCFDENQRGQGRIKCKSIAQLFAPKDAAR